MHTPFEKRVCITICLCQLTAVLSCVSIVYLAVGIYSPGTKTYNSGFLEQTVMCTTVSNISVPNCEIEGEALPTWTSCGEWCLSKSSGSCTQIRVDVRTNGSNIRLEGCEDVDIKYCHGIDPKKKDYECINGECEKLDGIFNCTKGAPKITGEVAGAKCKNLTSVLSCNLTTTDSPSVCNDRTACLNLDGLYECNSGSCARVRPPYKCEKRCIDIKTGGKSIVVRQGDVIFTANCERAVEVETNNEIWPTGLTTKSGQDHPVLMMFCTNLHDTKEPNSYFLTDCFNGTLLEHEEFANLTNIQGLLNVHLNADRLLDPVQRRYAPPEQDLLIYNSTPLYINYEGCVNTLILNECEKFYAEYGGDGRELRTQSRFQCFYDPDFDEFVVLRFNRIRTLMELMIASIVPTTLAIVSCFTLVFCTRIIHVGDDSHFYFQCCGADAKATMQKETVEAMAL